MTSRRDVLARIERANTQRIYLLDRAPCRRTFRVEGTTGRTYTVRLVAPDPTCTCLDYSHNGHRCKHIYFVLRQLGVVNATEQPLHATEIEALAQTPIYANRYKEATTLPSLPLPQPLADRRRPYIDETCAICLEPMHADTVEPNVACARCGNSLHLTCFAMWSKRNRTCVYCRADMA